MSTLYGKCAKLSTLSGLSILVIAFISLLGCGGGGDGDGSSTNSTSGGVAGPTHQASYKMASPDGYTETGTITYSETAGSLTLAGDRQSCGPYLDCEKGTYTEVYNVTNPRDITDEEFIDLMNDLETDIEDGLPGVNFTYDILL